MRPSFYYSLLLHLSLVLLMYFGLPSFFHKDLNVDYAMVTEVVPISELTNVKVKTSDRKDNEQTQTKKAPKSVEKEEEKEEQAKPEKSKEKAPEPQKVEDAEKIPDKKVPEEKKKKEEKKVEEKKKDNKKTPEKKAPEKQDKKKKPKEDSFEKSILKSLEEESKKKDDKKIDKEFKDLADALKGDTNKEFNDSAPMSMSEIDAIKAQIVRNWNTASFSGAAETAGMQVVVLIDLDMDGNVLNVTPKLDGNKSGYYQIFVESAVRSVKSASPLQNLSKDKFHRWKAIEFRFDSSGMIY